MNVLLVRLGHASVEVLAKHIAYFVVCLPTFRAGVRLGRHFLDSEHPLQGRNGWTAMSRLSSQSTSLSTSQAHVSSTPEMATTTYDTYDGPTTLYDNLETFEVVE